MVQSYESTWTIQNTSLGLPSTEVGDHYGTVSAERLKFYNDGRAFYRKAFHFLAVVSRKLNFNGTIQICKCPKIKMQWKFELETGDRTRDHMT